MEVGDDVHEQANRGDNDHYPALDFTGREKPLVGLIEDEAANSDQKNGIQKRGENLESIPAVAAALAAWEHGKGESEIGEEEGGEIGEHMGGVGEQRQAAALKASRDFHEHDHARQAHGEDEPAALGPAALLIAPRLCPVSFFYGQGPSSGGIISITLFRPPGSIVRPWRPVPGALF